MVFKTIDYAGHRYDATVELEYVQRIEVKVVSGDEIVDILRKDGIHTTFDPMNDPMNSFRTTDYFDYSYVIYDEEKGVDAFEKDWFKNRKDSYSVINNYPVTKDYILKYDLSGGTDAYVDDEVIKMLLSGGTDENENVNVDNTYTTIKINTDTIERIFKSEYISFDWKPDHIYYYLRSCEAMYNNRLASKGYLFLNELLSDMGYKETKMGTITGWIFDKNNYNKISFGIDYNKKFNPDTESIILTIKTDGVIIDKIDIPEE